MSEPSSSYANIPPASTLDEVDSLPSSSAGSTTSMSPSEEEELSDAEREWNESLQQIELLLTMVLVPYLGKYFGRKCAYWGTSCDNRSECEHIADKRQVGDGSWSGNTPSVLRLLAQEPSRVLALSRPPLHFEAHDKSVSDDYQLKDRRLEIVAITMPRVVQD